MIALKKTGGESINHHFTGYPGQQERIDFIFV